MFKNFFDFHETNGSCHWKAAQNDVPNSAKNIDEQYT